MTARFLISGSGAAWGLVGGLVHRMHYWQGARIELQVRDLPTLITSSAAGFVAARAWLRLRSHPGTAPVAQSDARSALIGAGIAAAAAVTASIPALIKLAIQAPEAADTTSLYRRVEGVHVIGMSLLVVVASVAWGLTLGYSASWLVDVRSRIAAGREAGWERWIVALFGLTPPMLLASMVVLRPPSAVFFLFGLLSATFSFPAGLLAAYYSVRKVVEQGAAPAGSRGSAPRIAR